MSKSTVLAELAKKYGLTEDAVAELSAVIVPVKTPKNVGNPDIVDENGNVTQRYCNLHKCYEPIINFPTGKKKECRAGIWRWNQINRKMNVIVDQLMDIGQTYKIGQYNEFKEVYNELRTSRVPGGAGYNLDKDWEEYSNKDSEEPITDDGEEA